MPLENQSRFSHLEIRPSPPTRKEQSDRPALHLQMFVDFSFKKKNAFPILYVSNTSEGSTVYVRMVVLLYITYVCVCDLWRLDERLHLCRDKVVYKIAVRLV